MLPKKTKFCNFGKLWRRFVCVLDCIVENIPCVFFFPFSSKCAVLGDSVEVLEKCWGFFPPLPPKGYSSL